MHALIKITRKIQSLNCTTACRLSTLKFIIDAQHNFARATTINLPHGQVATPVYMPVGTKAAMKGITYHQMAQMGCKILLANTYHLASYSTTSFLKQAGGIHHFVGWDRNILTDSGGYQMVSFDQLSITNQKGVLFTNPYNRQIMFLSPQEAVYQQNNIGSDIAMVLDDVVRPTTALQRTIQATQRTIRWAERCKNAQKRANQVLFPIVQGGVDPQLRKSCVRQLVKLKAQGYAIGGLSGGQDKIKFIKTVKLCCDLLPKNVPRYLMGVGYPVDLVLCACLGVDMFDCVFATRTARFGTAFTAKGPIKLTQSKYAKDFESIDEDCTCQACLNYSRAYLHFIKMQDNFAELVSIHNVCYLLQLMSRLRQAIKKKQTQKFAIQFVQNYYQKQQKVPIWVKHGLQLANFNSKLRFPYEQNQFQEKKQQS